MSVRFVESKKGVQECDKCYFTFQDDDCCKRECHGTARKDGKTGYYVRTRPRKSRDRRLLEALLSGQFGTSDTGIWIGVRKTRFSESQMKQLIAIKEAMKRKGTK